MKKRTLILSLVAATGLLNYAHSSSIRKLSTHIKFYPVKYSKREKSTLDYNGSSLLPLSRKPAATLDEQEVKIENGIIKFYLDEKTEKSLAKAAKRYDKLALVMDDDKVIHTASSKEVINQEMTIRHPQNFEHLVERITD